MKGTTVEDLQRVLAEGLREQQSLIHEPHGPDDRGFVVDGFVSVRDLAETVLAAGYAKVGAGRGDAA